MMELSASERAELEWWRHFRSKLSKDSELPAVGSALLGRCWIVLERKEPRPE